MAVVKIFSWLSKSASSPFALHVCVCVCVCFPPYPNRHACSLWKTGSGWRKKRKTERAHDGRIKACLCLREKRARRMRGAGGGGGGQCDEGASLLKEGVAAL